MVAEGVSIDSQRGGATVFNILERIASQGFPLFIARTVFFALWEKDPEDPNQVAVVFEISHNGNVLVQHHAQMMFADQNRSRQVIQMGGVVVPQPGVVTFSQTAGDVVARYSVDVVAGAPAVQPLDQQPANQQGADQ